MKQFNPGFGITPTFSPLGFAYDADCFGPVVERRSLDAIRHSLRKSDSDGPETVYAIAMDVGKKIHREFLEENMLLYGAVAYAAGKIGREPVRSQGHIHAVSPSCGASTPEVYEIWNGVGVIYMELGGESFAVRATPGEVVIVPPGALHMTVSADPSCPLAFGAWCVRDFGFDYREIRAHGGPSFFPFFDAENRLYWEKNPCGTTSCIHEISPRIYTEFRIDPAKPIYAQFEEDRGRFRFVNDPEKFHALWQNFRP